MRDVAKGEVPDDFRKHFLYKAFREAEKAFKETEKRKDEMENELREQGVSICTPYMVEPTAGAGIKGVDNAIEGGECKEVGGILMVRIILISFLVLLQSGCIHRYSDEEIYEELEGIQKLDGIVELLQRIGSRRFASFMKGRHSFLFDFKKRLCILEAAQKTGILSELPLRERILFALSEYVKGSRFDLRWSGLSICHTWGVHKLFGRRWFPLWIFGLVDIDELKDEETSLSEVPESKIADELEEIVHSPAWALPDAPVVIAGRFLVETKDAGKRIRPLCKRLNKLRDAAIWTILFYIQRFKPGWGKDEVNRILQFRKNLPVDTLTLYTMAVLGAYDRERAIEKLRLQQVNTISLEFIRNRLRLCLGDVEAIKDLVELFYREEDEGNIYAIAIRSLVLQVLKYSIDLSWKESERLFGFSTDFSESCRILRDYWRRWFDSNRDRIIFDDDGYYRLKEK